MIEYLKVGQIINTHGIKGEVKVYPLTDNIKRFKALKFVYMKNGEQFIKVQVENVKYNNEIVILKLSNINDMNEALKFKNVYIYIDRENVVKLPEDTYFIADLIGLKVYSDDDKYLGCIVSVLPTGSNDVYEIKQESGKTFLIPAIKEVVKLVDITSGKIVIKLIEGLL